MKGEKKLLATPWPECPETEQKAPEKPDRYSTIRFIRFAAQIVELDGEKVLGVTTFSAEGHPRRRYWLSYTQRGMECYADEKPKYGTARRAGKMYGTSIDQEESLTNYHYYTNKSVLYSTTEHEERVLCYTGGQGSASEELARYTAAQRESEIKCRNERKRQSIQQWFELLPPIPDELREWELDVLTKEDRYFFYTYTGKNRQSGTCSYCGMESELEGVKSGKWGQCPHCGSRVKFKSIKQIGRGMSQRYWTKLLQPASGYIVSRSFCVCIDHYLKDGRPVTRLGRSEINRMFYEVGSLRPAASFSTSSGTYAVTVNGFHEAQGENATIIAPCNIETIRRACGLRAPLETLAERGLLYGRLPGLIKKGRRPEIEYLIKLGLFKLCRAELNTEYGYRHRLFKGRTAEEVLGLPRSEIDKLRRADVSGEAFEVIRQLYKSGYELKTEDMQQLDRLGIRQNRVTTLWEMTERSSLKKALNYIEKQRGKYDGDHVLQEWSDYMRMAAAAGWNVDVQQIQFPKHLHAEHDKAAAAAELKQNAEQNRKIEKCGERLKPLSWSFDGLCIFPALSSAELIREGSALDHCVGKGTYARQMANGVTAIFFIRKEQAKETPYVTLELSLKTGRVIQCYGKSDSYPGVKVKNFYLRWEKEIVSRHIGKKEVSTA